MNPSGIGPVNAVALRRSRFSETSLMVTWFTSEHGKVRTSARSALRPGSPLAGRVDLFHETRIFWTPARRGDVHTLKEAEITCAFRPVEPVHSAIQAASYFAELVGQCTQPEEPQPELYDLLLRALGFLRQNPPSRLAVRYFEKETARFLGILEERREPEISLREYMGFSPPQRGSLWSQLPEK